MNPILNEVAKAAIEVVKETAKEYLKNKCNEGKIIDVENSKNTRPNLFLPRDNGSWTQQPGESTWNPDPDYIPKKENPMNKKWEEISKENNLDGVPFKNKYPDFGKVSKAEVSIENFTTNRADNFNQADQNLAKQWNDEQKDNKAWKPSEVASYRKENNLTWHEKEDMQTLQLLPREVHANIPHEGGIAAKKNENLAA